MKAIPRRLFLACCALGSLALSGCQETGPRVYTARLYQAADGCLDAYAPIGLVEARALDSNCEAVCLLLQESVYVSTVCAPYPSTAEPVTPDHSPDCAAALALLAAGDDAACE